MSNELKEFHFEAESYDRLEPLDNGKPGFRLGGMREVEGSFSGRFDDALSAWLGHDEPVVLSLWGPDPDLPWWKHWFYRIRQALGGQPYPHICLASGPANLKFEKEYEDGEDIVMTGSFTKAGVWTFHND